jgi:hypothetical protein
VRLFFHHVGQKGADEDFKKTVYKEIASGKLWVSSEKGDT